MYPFWLRDLFDLLIQLSLVLVALAVAWFFFRKATNSGEFIDKLVGLDRAKTMLLLTLFCMTIGIGSNVAMIVAVIKYSITEPVIIALIGNFNGAVTASCVAMPTSYWFGTSDGSRAKDEKEG